jgi:hypothetical protein
MAGRAACLPVRRFPQGKPHTHWPLLARTTSFKKRFMNEQATEKHARFISGYEAAYTGKPAHWRKNDFLNSFQVRKQ